MKVLVTGSRKWQDAYTIQRALWELVVEHLDEPLTLIHGGAAGADSVAGKWWSHAVGPCQVVLPRWDLYGNSAGHVRNQEMVDMLEPGDVVLAFLRDESPGTTGCVNAARRAGFDVRVFTETSEEDTS